MKKEKISLIINMFIIILEIIGFFVTLRINHKISYEFYTEDSNILALIVSCIYVFFLLKKHDIPRWVQLLKYMTTICLSLTFLVVILILAPMYNFNYGYLLFKGSLLYQHLLCPILSIISFIFFDNIKVLEKKDSIKGISITIIYAVILVILNIMDFVKGPYPFLMVKNQPIFISSIWFLIIISLTYLIAYLLRKLHVKFR